MHHPRFKQELKDRSFDQTLSGLQVSGEAFVAEEATVGSQFHEFQDSDEAGCEPRSAPDAFSGMNSAMQRLVNSFRAESTESTESESTIDANVEQLELDVEVKPLCFLCKAPGKRCCKETFYCGTACQKSDLKRHGPDCISTKKVNTKSKMGPRTNQSNTTAAAGSITPRSGADSAVSSDIAGGTGLRFRFSDPEFRNESVRSNGEFRTSPVLDRLFEFLQTLFDRGYMTPELLEQQTLLLEELRALDPDSQGERLLGMLTAITERLRSKGHLVRALKQFFVNFKFHEMHNFKVSLHTVGGQAVSGGPLGILEYMLNVNAYEMNDVFDVCEMTDKIEKECFDVFVYNVPTLITSLLKDLQREISSVLLTEHHEDMGVFLLSDETTSRFISVVETLHLQETYQFTNERSISSGARKQYKEVIKMVNTPLELSDLGVLSDEFNPLLDLLHAIITRDLTAEEIAGLVQIVSASTLDFLLRMAETVARFSVIAIRQRGLDQAAIKTRVMQRIIMTIVSHSGLDGMAIYNRFYSCRFMFSNRLESDSRAARIREKLFANCQVQLFGQSQLEQRSDYDRGTMAALAERMHMSAIDIRTGRVQPAWIAILLVSLHMQVSTYYNFPQRARVILNQDILGYFRRTGHHAEICAVVRRLVERSDKHLRDSLSDAISDFE